jgi:hypothetical protein
VAGARRGKHLFAFCSAPAPTIAIGIMPATIAAAVISTGRGRSGALALIATWGAAALGPRIGIENASSRSQYALMLQCCDALRKTMTPAGENGHEATTLAVAAHESGHSGPKPCRGPGEEPGSMVWQDTNPIFGIMKR